VARLAATLAGIRALLQQNGEHHQDHNPTSDEKRLKCAFLPHFDLNKTLRKACRRLFAPKRSYIPSKEKN
jgi:hypothetical protein